VLIVDDNADAGELLEYALKAHGFQTVLTQSPHEALELALERSPCVAVLDIGLPEMDGVELAKRLRVDHPNMTMLALTGYGQQADRVRTREAGFAEHLVKPVDIGALVVLLDALT